MFNAIKNFVNNERGATAIEYGLIAGAISVGIVAIAGTVGTDIVAEFTAISTALQANNP